MAKDSGGHGSEGKGSGSSLRSVEQHWDDLGIEHHISQRDDVVKVDKIVVPKERRNGGVGSEAMNALTEHADKHGLRVALTPDDAFGGSKKRLTEFYKRFGFKENKGRSRDLSISHAMIREPGKPPHNTPTERRKVQDR